MEFIHQQVNDILEIMSEAKPFKQEKTLGQKDYLVDCIRSRLLDLNLDYRLVRDAVEIISPEFHDYLLSLYFNHKDGELREAMTKLLKPVSCCND